MKRTAIAASVAAALSAGAIVAWASSPDAWNDLEKKVRETCIAAAADVEGGTAKGPLTDFEGHVVAEVTGKWRNPSMEGREARFICLYDKESGEARAEEAGVFP